MGDSLAENRRSHAWDGVQCDYRPKQRSKMLLYGQHTLAMSNLKKRRTSRSPTQSVRYNYVE